jgi:histidinol-phosphate aminotransferase
LHYDLKEYIANFRKVDKTQIFLGVGSDEAIDILFRIFCNPREDNVVITPPTYGMYKVCAKINDVAVKSASLTPDFDVDIQTTLTTIDEKTKLLFLCSPGNPTSKVIPSSVIETIAKSYQHGIIVVDEAYIDFCGEHTAIPLLTNYPNIIVLQTMSKAFGLAGIRLGMAFASREITQLMNNVKAPYNVNKLTVQVALNAYQNIHLFQTNLAKLQHEKTLLRNALTSLSIVQKVYPSDANFILFRIEQAYTIYKQMADAGVVCRYRGTEMHCTDCLRVTVGTPEENAKFLQLLVSIAKELNVSATDGLIDVKKKG